VILNNPFFCGINALGGRPAETFPGIHEPLIRSRSLSASKIASTGNAPQGLPGTTLSSAAPHPAATAGSDSAASCKRHVYYLLRMHLCIAGGA